MTTYLWPGDTGWPTPEEDEVEVLDLPDLEAELDLDALSLHAPPPHLFEGLSVTELAVLSGRFGLGGQRVRTMKELHVELDLPRQELREQLASALAKLRDQLLVD